MFSYVIIGVCTVVSLMAIAVIVYQPNAKTIRTALVQTIATTLPSRIAIMSGSDPANPCLALMVVGQMHVQALQYNCKVAEFAERFDALKALYQFNVYGEYYGPGRISLAMWYWNEVSIMHCIFIFSCLYL